ncbi:alpha/beta hydrolase [Micrococcus sp. HG099]|uniref:alpha/beta fold hydrolase n=1 Tax=Micrococcus sp. HG099 TaxID=2969755 RepID=UPI00130D96F5|nr:alpha/beta fold hydrolase [Micrococcus sp. HG099]MCR8675705.1 alpha/beta hydrolase [Micrococcus sp. HG099]
MAQPTVTTTLLKAAESPARVLLVGAGLGTGVHALWSLAAQRMAEDTLVIGYDLPGHGASAPHADPFTIAELADAVVAAVARLKDEGAIPADVPLAYAGVSLNGCVALQLALEHADVVSGVAVVCSAAKIGEAKAWHERAELVEKAGTPTMVAGSAERWFAPGFIERHPERTTDLLHTLQEADRHSYARLCEALAGFDVRERLGEIRVPVLTVHGAHDAVTPPAAGEEIAAAVPGTTVVALDDAAHQAPLEQPVATAEALAAFLTTVQEAAK